MYWIDALLLSSRLSIDVSQVHLPANRTAELKHECLCAALNTINVAKVDRFC
jgi:hypothetical protein